MPLTAPRIPALRTRPTSRSGGSSACRTCSPRMTRWLTFASRRAVQEGGLRPEPLAAQQGADPGHQGRVMTPPAAAAARPRRRRHHRQGCHHPRKLATATGWGGRQGALAGDTPCAAEDVLVIATSTTLDDKRATFIPPTSLTGTALRRRHRKRQWRRRSRAVIPVTR